MTDDIYRDNDWLIERWEYAGLPWLRVTTTRGKSTILPLRSRLASTSSLDEISRVSLILGGHDPKDYYAVRYGRWAWALLPEASRDMVITAYFEEIHTDAAYTLEREAAIINAMLRMADALIVDVPGSVAAYQNAGRLQRQAVEAVVTLANLEGLDRTIRVLNAGAPLSSDS